MTKEVQDIIRTALFTHEQKLKNEVHWAAMMANRHPRELFFYQLEIESRAKLSHLDLARKEVGLGSCLVRCAWHIENGVRHIHWY